MSKHAKGRYFRAIARTTLVAFALGVVAPPFALTRAFSEGEASASRTVAVVEFQQQGTAPLGEATVAATNAAALALVELPNTIVVPGDKVKQTMQAKGLKQPLTKYDLMVVGKEVGAGIILSGAVVNVSQGDSGARVALDTSLVDVASGDLLARTRSLGKSGKGPGDTGAEALRKAAQQAGAAAVRELQEILSMQGIVISKPKEGYVRSSIGAEKRLLPGAEVAIMEKGVTVATGTVKNVDVGESLIGFESKETAKAVNVGADVRVLYNPSPGLAKDLSEPSKRKKDERKSSNSLLFALVLVAAAAAAFGGGGGGGDDGGGAVGSAQALLEASASPTEAPAVGGKSVITATATGLNGSAPLSDGGYKVTFATDKGSLSDAEFTTNGTDTTFTSDLTNDGTVGTAIVTVKIVDIRAPLTATVTDKVTVNFLASVTSKNGRKGKGRRR
jgi:hypothetical protein